MLIISGPQTPFANIPVIIEHTVQFWDRPSRTRRRRVRRRST